MNHVRRPVRSNPRAPAAPKNPLAVVVQRFDPTGEELPRWEVLARDADGRAVFLSATQAKAAALHPPRDAGLHVGDLIATVPAEAAAFPEEYATRLYVVAPDGVKAAPKPPKELGGPWLATWGQNAYKMLAASVSVGRKRLVMAACECAETVLHHVPEGEERPRIAIETARAWCFGRASLNDVRAAARAAYAAAYAAHNASASAAADASASAAAAAPAAAALAARAASSAYAASAAYSASGTSRESTYRALAPLVDRWIPLPVAILSALGYPNAIPFDPSAVLAEDTGACLPRENPRSRPRRRSRR